MTVPVRTGAASRSGSGDFVGEFLFSVAQNTNYNPFNLFYQEIPELNLRVKRGLAGAASQKMVIFSSMKKTCLIRLYVYRRETIILSAAK